MEGHCVGQLTDASVVLRFGYQAIRRAGLTTELHFFCEKNYIFFY